MTVPISNEELRLLSQTGDLISRARTGDEQARDDLLRRYQPRLIAFLRARLPASARGLLETQDLVQEVSMQALRAIPRFEYRGVGSYWAFIRKIALDHVHDVYRRAARRGFAETYDEASAADPTLRASGALGGLVRKELWQQVEIALVDLPERERGALLLRIELGLEYAFIASECGYPSPDAARMAIGRALEQLVKRLSHE